MNMWKARIYMKTIKYLIFFQSCSNKPTNIQQTIVSMNDVQLPCFYAEYIMPQLSILRFSKDVLNRQHLLNSVINLTTVTACFSSMTHNIII